MFTSETPIKNGVIKLRKLSRIWYNKKTLREIAKLQCQRVFLVRTISLSGKKIRNEDELISIGTLTVVKGTRRIYSQLVKSLGSTS